MPYRNGKLFTWKVRVSGIKCLLTDNESDKQAQYVSKRIYQILTSKLYKSHFKTFISLEKFNSVITCNDLNNMLDKMYDYCDANLIWIS